MDAERGREGNAGLGKRALVLESMVCSFSQLYLVLLLYSAKQYMALLGLVRFAVLLAGNLTVDPLASCASSLLFALLETLCANYAEG